VQQPDGTFFDPAPPWTQCSDFDTSVGRDYVAVIIGNVGTRRYAVTIEINEDDPAYTKPGTELRPGNINSGGSIEVYEMGGKNRRWQQVYGPALQDTVIVLHTNRCIGHSGCLDGNNRPVTEKRRKHSSHAGRLALRMR